MVWKESIGEYLKQYGINRRFWTDFVRPEIFRIKGKKCQECGSTERLCIHHTDYENQNINTMNVLCFKCHMQEHKK